ncbi:MAG: TolC family protein [Campylobacterota bacterium]|nr:TolC family protein [Campylobacterota bacterium]
MKKNILFRLSKLGLYSISIVLLSSGCSKLGPDFNAVEQLNTPKEQATKNEQIAQWWKIFDDPLLDSLVTKTYAQNLDLKSAGLRILQARAVLGISQGLTFAQQQTLSGSAAAIRSNGNSYGAVGVNFDVGWEMDVWGKYARGIESSEADLYASIASYSDIMVSVIAEVARNYINYRTAQERIAYARRNIVIQERVTRMTEIQFNSGNVSELDMQQARSQLYTTRSSLPSLELSMITTRNAMALLMGIDLKEMETILNSSKKHSDTLNKYINQEKNYVQIQEEDKASISIEFVPTAKFDPYYKVDAQLLKNRPDIKVAEYLAHSNSAKIGTAMAQLYPSFVLFGNIGINTNSASGSWSSASDSIGVGIGPSFSWNIFAYDRIKNQVRLQDAIFEESLVNYNKKVLQAATEVSDAIHGYRLTNEQQEENKKAVEATVRAFNISMTQYNDGLVSYQRLLSTVESLTRNQDRYAQIKGSLATYIVSLYKALGGGWQMSQGEAYLSNETAKKMQERTDWGDYLDKNMTRLPKGMW